MIFLLLAVAREGLIPNPKRMDYIDHACLLILKICLLTIFLTLPHAVLSEDSSGIDPNKEFFFACSGGKLDQVKEYLNEHPNWVNGRTDNGEACLHLTGIYGYSDVTEYLLTHGADPNIRSTFDDGLRMHPLSWNVYGGHIANVDLLLRYGADVNLDFDGMGKDAPKVTALDVVRQLTVNEGGDERFILLEKLLKENGAKTMAEVQGGEL